MGAVKKSGRESAKAAPDDLERGRIVGKKNTHESKKGKIRGATTGQTPHKDRDQAN